MTADELIAAALRLPDEDRVRVVAEVLASLEVPEDVAEEAWAAEIERRSAEVAAGRVQTAAWETVQARLLTKLERLRESRRSS